MKEHTYGKEIPKNKYNPLAWICEGAKIGENVWIGSGVYISENVEVGNNVSISNGVQIFDHDNSLHRVSEGKIPTKKHKIKIGDFTQIGSSTVILADNNDVIIGDHVIVGAMSLVKRNIPSSVIAYGIPCRVESYLDLKKLE